MRKIIDKLIKESKNEKESVKIDLYAIANKVERRNKHLIIDVLRMESIVDESRVEEADPIDRIEVEV